MDRGDVYLKQLELHLSKIRNEANYEQGLSQRITQFAQKMNIIGDEKVDVNNFINYEIELCYKKITFQMQRRVENVQIMEDKVERLKKDLNDPSK